MLMRIPLRSSSNLVIAANSSGAAAFRHRCCLRSFAPCFLTYVYVVEVTFFPVYVIACVFGIQTVTVGRFLARDKTTVKRESTQREFRQICLKIYLAGAEEARSIVTRLRSRLRRGWEALPAEEVSLRRPTGPGERSRRAAASDRTVPRIRPSRRRDSRPR